MIPLHMYSLNLLSFLSGGFIYIMYKKKRFDGGGGGGGGGITLY